MSAGAAVAKPGGTTPKRRHGCRGPRFATVRRALLAWYDGEQRDLPWRRRCDAYAVWLSEIMLQQTRVETVLPYYHAFLNEFPDIHALAAAPLDDVLRRWAGLGYYSRARSLHAAARIVVGRFGGRFPDSVGGLRDLPGIGRYTAGAVASIAFGAPAPAVDGNVKRVLARLFGVRESIDEAATEARLWAIAGRLVGAERPGDLNQALMELGATVCRPGAPACETCPLRASCAAAKAGDAASLPKRSPKRPAQRVRAAAAAVWRRGRILLIKRPARGLLGGLWQLPSAVVWAERPSKASLPGADGDGVAGPGMLAAALHAQFGVQPAVGAALGVVEHVFTHRRLRLEVYACDFGAAPLASRPAEARWVAPALFEDYALSSLDRKALRVALQGRRPRRMVPLGEKPPGDWCNGSTTDSGSVSKGSNPLSPVRPRRAVRQMSRRPTIPADGTSRSEPVD